MHERASCDVVAYNRNVLCCAARLTKFTKSLYTSINIHTLLYRRRASFLPIRLDLHFQFFYVLVSNNTHYRPTIAIEMPSDIRD